MAAFVVIDDCGTPTLMTRGWQNKQIGRGPETVLSGYLFILYRLVTMESSRWLRRLAPTQQMEK